MRQGLSAVALGLDLFRRLNIDLVERAAKLDAMWEGCVRRIHLHAPSEKTSVKSRFTPVGLSVAAPHIASTRPRAVPRARASCQQQWWQDQQQQASDHRGVSEGRIAADNKHFQRHDPDQRQNR